MTRDIKRDLGEAGEAFKAARQALAQARALLIPIMIEALRSDQMSQREIIELSGYTRERVRLLARSNGVPAE